MKPSFFRVIISVLLACMFIFGAQAQAAAVDVACAPAALVAAINAANATPEADTLNLKDGCVYTFTSAADIDATLGNSALPRITTPVTINGNGATLGRDVIAPNFRLLRVESSGSLSLDNLTITGGKGLSGAGVYNFSLLNLTTVVMSGNNANPYGADGGAIANHSNAVINIEHSTFSENSANDFGGAISNRADGGPGIIHVRNSIFTGNNGHSGGGIANNGGNVVILESVFSGNAAVSNGDGSVASGGAIGISSGQVDIFNSVISGNTGTNGGGISKGGTDALNIVNSVLSGNRATEGGGLRSISGPVTIVNSTISGNSADQAGGLLVIAGFSLYNSIVWGNSSQIAGSQGVAIHSIFETLPGTDNLPGTPNADILFVSPVSHTLAPTTAGDYRVQANSPALNVGTNSAIPVDQYDLDYDADTNELVLYDLDGNPRVVNGTIDIGAYEHQTLAAIVLNESTVNLSEGGATGAYTIALASKPAASVTVTPTGDSQCTVSAPLTFTIDNWNTPQEISVTAVDDATAEGDHTCTITHSATSADTPYNGIGIATVTGDIADNDVSGVEVQPTTVEVAEGGTTSAYAIVLNSQPTADVTITPTGDSQCTVSAPLTFTIDNWNTPQEITVTAVDDATAEGDHTCTITYAVASNDANYAGVSVADVTGDIADDDPFATELLFNGGFETNEDGNKIPDGWTIVRKTHDKLVCNPDKAYAGNCAFKVQRGTAGKRGADANNRSGWHNRGCGRQTGFERLLQGQRPIGQSKNDPERYLFRQPDPRENASAHRAERSLYTRKPSYGRDHGTRRGHHPNNQAQKHGRRAVA
jgi:hypothetical protein